MENVLLIIHLILALSLIAIVLLQRSEGGGLGIGGGGGVMSARGAATALGKVTWSLAAAFIMTSIALTVLSARDSASGSVADQITDQDAAPVELPVPEGLNLDGLLPPAGGDASGDSLLPPRAE